MNIIFVTPDNLTQLSKFADKGASSIAFIEHPDGRDGEPANFQVAVNFGGVLYRSEEFATITECISELQGEI